MAFAGKTTDKELDKGRIEKTRVKRYWQGRAPDWGEVQDDDLAAPRERLRTEIAAPVIVKRGDDARLRRMAGGADDKEEGLQRRREVRPPEVLSSGRRHPRDDEDEEEEEEEEGGGADAGRASGRDQAGGDGGGEVLRRPSHGSDDGGAGATAVKEEDEEDEEELAAAARRKVVRDRLLQHRQEEELLKAEEEEEEEDSSEYETDSEDEQPFGGRRMTKPQFVPKEQRNTILEREKLAAEEAEVEVKAKLRLEERKVETRQIVVERIAQEEAALRAAKAGPLALADVNTDDEEDEQKEYEAWKQRELKRIKTEREEKEEYERETNEREKLKNMTDDERRAWERANPKAEAALTKAKWGFMQKYYHKGAYFQEAPDDTRGTAGTDQIYRRDFSAPTGEDRFDKSALPTVMQVKNFGRSGRTKWSHLLAEDTSQQATAGDPLMMALKEQQQKREREAFAQPEQFAKPKKFKAQL